MVMNGTRPSTEPEESVSLSRLAQQVAASCGFSFVPAVRLRRGRGGDWNPTTRLIRIGRGELRGDHGHLWYVLAHELAHAQAELRKGHSRAFWVRLAKGLEHAGRLELLRYGFGYRETVLRVAEEYGLQDVPRRAKFKLSPGTVVDDGEGRRWRVVRRFRRAGAPYYQLKTPGWSWITAEQALPVQRMAQ